MYSLSNLLTFPISPSVNTDEQNTYHQKDSILLANPGFQLLLVAEATH
jgi:hypothetical protein